MAALVLRQDLEPRSDSEANNRNERIPESNAIDVMVPGATNQITRLLVAPEKPIENR